MEKRHSKSLEKIILENNYDILFSSLTEHELTDPHSCS